MDNDYELKEHTMTETKLRPGKIRDFFTGLPEACGVPKEVADIYAEQIGKIFDLEKLNPGSVFSRQPGQTIEERMAPAFDGWIRFAKDLGAAEFGRDMSVHLAKWDLYNRKGEGNLMELEEDAAYLEADQAEYPKVAALMPVAEAPLTSWN